MNDNGGNLMSYPLPTLEVLMTRAKWDSIEEFRAKRKIIQQRYSTKHRKPRISDIDRFWEHVTKSESCWEWQGAKANYGYGAFRVAGRTVKAHRWLWGQLNGPLADGTKILHHCDNPPCVRPSHLFTGSQADNIHDAMAKGRHVPPPHYGRSKP